MDFEDDDEREISVPVQTAATDVRGGNYDIVFMKGSQLQTIMAAIRPLLDNTFSLTVGANGLTLVEMDKSHVSLVQLSLEPSWFLSYKPGTNPTLAFDLDATLNMLKRVQGAFPLHMQNASWDDLQAWSASTTSDRDDQPIATRDNVSDVTHFTYRDEYGSNVVHKLRLMVFEPSDVSPSFPDPDAVSTLRINPSRLKNLINRIRITDAKDKEAAERAVLNILFQKDCITFSSEYQGTVHSMYQVYTPERTAKENIMRQRRLRQINERRDRCREHRKEFTLSDEEREIVEMPTLEIDKSVLIENRGGENGAEHCTTRLSIKYVLRMLTKASSFGAEMYLDVASVGLARIRYHLGSDAGTGKRKRAPTSRSKKKRRLAGEGDDDDDDLPEASSIDVPTYDDEEAETETERSDPTGTLSFWISPKVSEEDDIETGSNDPEERDAQKEFNAEFESDDDEETFE